MTDPSQLRPEDILHVLAGTYLRNVLRGQGACRHCGGWANPGYPTCYVCGHLSDARQPDAAGFLTYGADGTTAGTLMYGYKGIQATTEQQALVKLLAHRGLRHAGCAERIVGAHITHFSTVPSTRGRMHPLTALIAPFMRWPYHPLTHNPSVVPQRQMVQDDLFTSQPLPAGAHVLLIDDTWTSGNKPLSGTAALRIAGAGHVTTLCLARWLGFDFVQRPTGPPVGLQIALSQQHVYDLALCPFTGASCP